MTTIDKSGSSIEEIIREFRRDHSIRDHELQYEILKKPSKGFLGFFANKLALVRFQVPESEDRVRLFTETLLNKMGISFSKIHTRREGKTLHLSIEGIVETGFVIGKNGQMLETIQYLVNRVFEGDRKLERIYLDADGYRERREHQFLGKYIPQIKKVKSSGEALTLEPMPASDRRVIHRYIEQDRGLKTLTLGEGENKRIVIFPAKLNEKDFLQKQGAAPSKPNPRGKAPYRGKAKPQEGLPEVVEKAAKKGGKAPYKAYGKKPYIKREQKNKNPEE